MGIMKATTIAYMCKKRYNKIIIILTVYKARNLWPWLTEHTGRKVLTRFSE